MYKPLFLGISSGSIDGWLVIFGVAIFIIVGLILIVGIIIFFAVRYLIKLIRSIRKDQ